MRRKVCVISDNIDRAIRQVKQLLKGYEYEYNKDTTHHYFKTDEFFYVAAEYSGELRGTRYNEMWIDSNMILNSEDHKRIHSALITVQTDKEETYKSINYY